MTCNVQMQLLMNNPNITANGKVLTSRVLGDVGFYTVGDVVDGTGCVDKGQILETLRKKGVKLRSDYIKGLLIKLENNNIPLKWKALLSEDKCKMQDDAVKFLLVPW